MEITHSAIQKLKDLLVERGITDRSFRIYTSHSDCCCPSTYGLKITADGEQGDHLIEKDGLKLFVAPQVYETRSAATRDYADSELRITGAKTIMPRIKKNGECT